MNFLPEVEGVRMDIISTAYQPEINIVFNKLLKATKNLPDKRVELSSFIEVKGMKALGNQLTKLKTKEIQLIGPIEGTVPWPETKPAKVQNVDEEGVEDDLLEDSADEVGESDVASSTRSNDDIPFEIEWTIGSGDEQKPTDSSDDDYEEPPQMKLF